MLLALRTGLYKDLPVNRCPYPARVIILGLIVAQVLATVQIFLSNVHLYQALIAIRDAGYLPIPNQRIMSNLREFGPAFFGALFFTLSAGAGLSLFSLAAAWVRVRLLARRKLLLIVFLLPWTGSLLAVNRHGLCPMVTSYFLLIPPLVFAAALRWMPPRPGHGPWLDRMVLSLPLLVLALLWMPQVNSHLFVDVRDNLLLSNRLGKKVNDFYYAYTLYPAEAFKSLDQKILRTCNLEGIQEEPSLRSMERELVSHDYLPVAGYVAADLKIGKDDTTLVFEHRGKTILRTTPTGFFTDPGAVLRKFSSRADRYSFFRQFTFLSLLVGLPLSLYLILYALYQSLLSFFLHARSSSVIASLLCFLIGTALLTILHQGRTREIEPGDIAQALESEHWQKRLAALKVIEQEGMEIGNFSTYQRMLKSPHIPERYWLARALGVSRQAETYKDLLTLLDDPHPNVVSMAFYALGQRGENRAVGEIIKRIETSDDWYNQWYAYKALRALAWKQTRSKPEP